MNCPRCDGSVLEERVRDGITVDGCRSCRGIWLDRGELERLIARAAEDEGMFEARRRPDRGPHYDYDDDWDRDRWRGDGRRDSDGRDPRWSGRPPYRKKRWFESFTDIFD
jgi:uncharacterized protein